MQLVEEKIHHLGEEHVMQNFGVYEKHKHMQCACETIYESRTYKM